MKTCDMNDQKNFLICLFVFCSYYATPLMVIIICYTKLAIHVIRSNRTVANRMHKVGAMLTLVLKIFPILFYRKMYQIH